MEGDTSPLQPVPPISRPTLLMRDRKYTNPVRLNDIQEAVGKAPDELVPGLAADKLECLRISQHFLNRLFECDKKQQAKPRHSFFIVFCCLVDLSTASS